MSLDQLRRLGHRRHLGRGRRSASRWRRCTARSIAASTSSTPPTSTATATASGCSRACAASAATRSTSPPRRASACKPHVAEGFNRENLTAFVERSLKNLETRRARPAAAALPADGRLLPARGVRGPRRPGARPARSLLRRQRRARRGGAEGDRVPRRAVGADHLQHVPPAPGRAVLPRGASGAASASSRGCRCRRGCSPAS